jgi:hypothetical protein
VVTPSSTTPLDSTYLRFLCSGGSVFLQDIRDRSLKTSATRCLKTSETPLVVLMVAGVVRRLVITVLVVEQQTVAEVAAP